MTEATTSLAGVQPHSAPPLAAAGGETRRYLAFLRRPALPERATGFSLAVLMRVMRLYLLDVAIMGVLLALASAALASGFELPENEINSIEMSAAVVALIVLFAPFVEEIAFRSWLSGRPGQILAALIVAAGLGGLFVLSTQDGPPPVPPLVLLAAILAAAIAALVGLR